MVTGVDSSTQSTKVELRRADSGELLGSGSAPHTEVVPPVAEQDPEVWLAAFHQAFAHAKHQAAQDGQSVEVSAISVAGQQHGMVCLDAQDHVIRPAKLWCDTSSAADADWLLEQLPGGASGFAQACGSVPVAAFTISKLSWLQRNEPESWQRLSTVLLPHDWMTFALTNNKVTDRGDASGTGYWSPKTNEYCWDLLRIVDSSFDWEQMLPRVLGPIEPAGEWNEILVAPGTGDNMAAALGLGLEPGEVVISLGTSGTVFCVSHHASSDDSGAVAGFADATGKFLPLVCTQNATKVTDTIARLCGLDLAALDAVALACPAGADGLTLLPYLDGERTPNRPTATGQMNGLRTDTSVSQLARAAFEGVLCGLLDGLDELSKHADTSGRILLVGGGAHSLAYRQVLADLTGREIVTSTIDQAVAMGACVQAAATLLGRDPAELRSDWLVGTEHITLPDPAAANKSEEIRSRYQQLRDS